MSHCKEKYVPTRMGSKLLQQIENYMESNKMKDRSKAIRTLIEMGLSMSSTQGLFNGGSLRSNIKCAREGSL